MPVVVQVGHNSLAEARELAAHAQRIAASAPHRTPFGWINYATLFGYLALIMAVGWSASWCVGGKPANLSGLTRATVNSQA